MGGARPRHRALLPRLRQHKQCSLILLGSKQPALLIDGEAKPFDPATLGACIAVAPGYSMGFDAAVRAQSFTDVTKPTTIEIGGLTSFFRDRREMREQEVPQHHSIDDAATAPGMINVAFIVLRLQYKPWPTGVQRSSGPE